MSKPGDLWLLGDHRLLCGDATDPEAVARRLDGAEPTLLATDPPYGVSLDPTWRDRAGYDTLGPATLAYMRRTDGHRNVTLSGDTRVDWSETFELVPSLTVGYVWHAGVYAAEVAAGLERIGFEITSQVIWDKGLFAMSRGWYHCQGRGPARDRHVLLDGLDPRRSWRRRSGAFRFPRGRAGAHGQLGAVALGR